MKRFLERSYAPQRLVSFHQKVEKRQRDEAANLMAWVTEWAAERPQMPQDRF